LAKVESEDMIGATGESTMSKGDFAAAIGVTAGRVSQYIAERKIYGPALDGEGRRARIRPSIATRQLQKTLEPSQRLGANGAAELNRHDGQLPFTPNPASAPSPAAEQPIDEIAAERLKQMRLRTAREEREEALSAGRYMDASEARSAMSRAVAEVFQLVDQGMQDMADALAEAFSIPQRDALAVLQKSFRSTRAKAATGFRDQADELPETVEE
jgi:hypothetical protein